MTQVLGIDEIVTNVGCYRTDAVEVRSDAVEVAKGALLF